MGGGRSKNPKDELLEYVFPTWTAKWGKCLAPGAECVNEPIKAHSLQRGGPLNMLAVDGHVMMLRQRLTANRPPTIDFERVGVGKASVFTGLCSLHDASLFEGIDKYDFDPSDREQLLLHAYRAVLREFHVSAETAVKLQLMYQKKGDLGLVRRDVPSPEGMFAVQRLIVAYETWMVKKRFDQAVLDGDHSALEHDVLDLGSTGPCVAVSSLFTIDEHSAFDGNIYVAMNVIPRHDGSTYTIFSYLRPDAAAARQHLDNEISSAGNELRYRISRLALERSDNIAFNPSIVDSWNSARREAIRAFFAATIMHNAPADKKDDRLNLFDTEWKIPN